MTLAVGAQAPDFTLWGVAGGERREYSLHEFKGQPVVLVFYPGDNTPVCTLQLNSYSDDMGRFADVGAQVLALSPQSVDSHAGFACAQGGFAFPLLADEGAAVGEAYGILGPLGFYRRSVFVVRPDGTIGYAHRAVAGLTFKKTDALLAALAESAAGT